MIGLTLIVLVSNGKCLIIYKRVSVAAINKVNVASITLHYITLHYITLHYITLHYITLHYITLHYITLHYTFQVLHFRVSSWPNLQTLD